MSSDEGSTASDRMLEGRGAVEIRDKYYMTYILSYALGTLTLVPANFFTTANDYWMYKFRNSSGSEENFKSENRTGLQAQFTSTYSIVANTINIAFLVITIAFLTKRLTIVQRIIGALCGVILMFIFTIVFVEINTDSWQEGFFIITLITGALLTGFCAIFMVTVFELVAKFPPVYFAALLSGQSICGIFSALIQIFSLSIEAGSRTSGLVYFLIGMIFVFMTLVYLIVMLNKSEFFRYHLSRKIQTERPKISKGVVLNILNKIKFYLLSIWIVLGCSIMIHPGVTSLVNSVDKGNGRQWNDVFFVPVTTFLCYNLFDYIGREISVKLRKPSNGIIILIAGICRISLVPMLMLCNAQPRHHLPVVFDKDFIYIILIIIFALSNGFLVNLCIIQIPNVTTEAEKKIAIILVLLFMVIGLGVCSFVSAALVNAL